MTVSCTPTEARGSSLWVEMWRRERVRGERARRRRSFPPMYLAWRLPVRVLVARAFVRVMGPARPPRGVVSYAAHRALRPPRADGRVWRTGRGYLSDEEHAARSARARAVAWRGARLAQEQALVEAVRRAVARVGGAARAGVVWEEYVRVSVPVPFRRLGGLRALSPHFDRLVVEGRVGRWRVNLGRGGRVTYYALPGEQS